MLSLLSPVVVVCCAGRWLGCRVVGVADRCRLGVRGLGWFPGSVDVVDVVDRVGMLSPAARHGDTDETALMMRPAGSAPGGGCSAAVAVAPGHP